MTWCLVPCRLCEAPVPKQLSSDQTRMARFVSKFKTPRENPTREPGRLLIARSLISHLECLPPDSNYHSSSSPSLGLYPHFICPLGRQITCHRLTCVTAATHPAIGSCLRDRHHAEPQGLHDINGVDELPHYSYSMMELSIDHEDPRLFHHQRCHRFYS